MGLGKVWQNVYVCGIGLFSYLTYLHFFLKIVEGNKHRSVNKTSRDKGGACANEKRKPCNRCRRSKLHLPRDTFIKVFVNKVILFIIYLFTSNWVWGRFAPISWVRFAPISWGNFATILGEPSQVSSYSKTLLELLMWHLFASLADRIHLKHSLLQFIVCQSVENMIQIISDMFC